MDKIYQKKISKLKTNDLVGGIVHIPKRTVGKAFSWANFNSNDKLKLSLYEQGLYKTLETNPTENSWRCKPFEISVEKEQKEVFNVFAMFTQGKLQYNILVFNKKTYCYVQ